MSSHLVRSLLAAAFLAATPAVAATESAPASASKTAEALSAAVASPERLPADRARDAWRHPQETLLFFGIEPEMRVLELWPEIVGEQLARVTRAKGVDEAALFVEVRSSAWLSELSMMKDHFLERVNARMGDADIERIVFVLAETV